MCVVVSVKGHVPGKSTAACHRAMPRAGWIAEKAAPAVYWMVPAALRAAPSHSRHDRRHDQSGAHTLETAARTRRSRRGPSGAWRRARAGGRGVARGTAASPVSAVRGDRHRRGAPDQPRRRGVRRGVPFVADRLAAPHPTRRASARHAHVQSGIRRARAGRVGRLADRVGNRCAGAHSARRRPAALASVRPAGAVRATGGDRGWPDVHRAVSGRRRHHRRQLSEPRLPAGRLPVPRAAAAGALRFHAHVLAPVAAGR